MISAWLSPGNMAPKLTPGQLFACEMRAHTPIDSNAITILVEWMHERIVTLIMALDELWALPPCDSRWVLEIAHCMEVWPQVIQEAAYDSLYISWFSRSQAP